MIDDDLAAIAAAQDFSAGIAMWRSANAGKCNSGFTATYRFSKPRMLPFTVAALLTVMNCVLLSFALLPTALSI